MMLITNLVCLFVGVVLGYYTCSYIIAKRCLEGTCELKLFFFFDTFYNAFNAKEVIFH